MIRSKCYLRIVCSEIDYYDFHKMAEIVSEKDFVLIRKFLNYRQIYDILSLYQNGKIYDTRPNYETVSPNTWSRYESALDKLLMVYRKALHRIRPLKVPRILYNDLKKAFQDRNRLKTFLLNYNDDTGIRYHIDHWSDWNMVLSIGHSAMLSFKTGKPYRINQGDIYIFNGNKKIHSVKIVSHYNLRPRRKHVRSTVQFRRELKVKK